MEIIALATVAGVLAAGVFILLPVAKTVVRVAPYAYPNARVRGMRAKLVKHDELTELSTRPYHDVVYALEKRMPLLARTAGADSSFAALDSALRTELVDSIVHLKRYSPEPTKKFLSVILSKYDIQVIQSIVRTQGAEINVKYDILHATEVFSQEFITRHTITIDALISELKGTVYQDVINAHREAIQQEEFEAFENALDHLYFARLLHTAKGVGARQYAKKLIDIHNVSLALKGREPSIPGGLIKPEELAGKDVPAIVKALSKHYGVAAETPQGLERELQLHLKHWSKRMLAKDPLSEASIIGFLALKVITTRNLAILLKLKQHDMPAERIQEVLVI